MKISFFEKYFEPSFKVPKKKINKKFTDINPKCYLSFKTNNYSVDQLKKICLKYNIKKNHTKEQLYNICYNIIKLTYYANVIQKKIKITLIKIYNRLHGPAFLKPNLCTNTTEFYSLENVNDIDYYHFFSYADSKNNIYGFDIDSIYELLILHKKTENPYNREEIPREIIRCVKKYYRYNRLFKIKKDKTNEENVNNQQTFNQHMVTRVFQLLDSLGNYTSMEWFSDLERRKLIIFLRELFDIWNYRSQLPIEKKREICPPYGNPFININMNHISDERIMLNSLKYVVLTVIERFINTGIDHESKVLGGYYVLSAFTLVHSGAANALPWLYSSVAHV